MRNRVALTMVVAVLLVAPAVFARDDAARDSDRTPEFGWVLVSNGSTIMTSLDEWNRLDELNLGDERVLFVRFGKDQYLIRDLHTLDRVDELVEPIRKLGQQVREMIPTRNGSRADKREWKERLRPLKEKRRDHLRRVSPDIEDLAREAVRRGQAERVN